MAYDKVQLGAQWSADQIAHATQGTWIVPPPKGWSASGLCIHAPTMRSGNLAVLRAPQEGSRGMTLEALLALQQEPAAVIMSGVPPQQLSGRPVLQVADTSIAILAMGSHARDRMAGKVLAVTGSAGKTTSVAMLAHALAAWGDVGSTSHSANLPHGVAWNLASMRAQAPHNVVELAIGKMGQSARMTRPHIALVTNILPAHLGEKSTIRDIALTKSAIFSAMESGSVAILNRDMQEWETVRTAAERRKLDILHFGMTDKSTFQLLKYSAAEKIVQARVEGRTIEYRLGAEGEHMARNSLAVLAAVTALGLPLEPALARLEHFCPLPGRGEECTIAIGGKNVNVIDDTYNANPGSMIAALENLSSRKAAGRKIAVLGEMAELGPQAENYHSELATLVERLDIDRFHVVGKLYENFWERIPDARKGSFAGSLDVLRGTLLDVCDEGDLVLLKGSHSTRIHQVAAWLKEQRCEQPH